MNVDEDLAKNEYVENCYDEGSDSGEEEREVADFGDPENKGPYLSIEEITEYVQQFAKNHHFVAIIKKTDKNINGDPFKKVFMCKRGGISSKPQKTIREGTSSQRCGCEFRWTATTSRSNLNSWFITVQSNRHNHQVDESIYRGHSQARRLTEEQHIMVGEMLKVSTVLIEYNNRPSKYY